MGNLTIGAPVGKSLIDGRYLYEANVDGFMWDLPLGHRPIIFAPMCALRAQLMLFHRSVRSSKPLTFCSSLRKTKKDPSSIQSGRWVDESSDMVSLVTVRIFGSVVMFAPFENRSGSRLSIPFIRGCEMQSSNPRLSPIIKTFKLFHKLV